MNHSAHVMRITGPSYLLVGYAEAIVDNLLAYLRLTPCWNRCKDDFAIEFCHPNTLTISFRTFEGYGREIGRPIADPQLSFTLESADEGHHYENTFTRTLEYVHSPNWVPSWYQSPSEIIHDGI